MGVPVVGERAPLIARLANFLYAVVLPGTLLVSSIYWVSAFPVAESRLLVMSVAHALNVALVAVDAILNAQVLRLAWMCYFYLFIAGYIGWTLIYAGLDLHLPAEECNCDPRAPSRFCLDDGSCSFAIVDWRDPQPALVAVAMGMGTIVPAVFCVAWVVDKAFGRCCAGSKAGSREAAEEPCCLGLLGTSLDTGAAWVDHFGRSALGIRPGAWLLVRLAIAGTWLAFVCFSLAGAADGSRWFWLLSSWAHSLQVAYFVAAAAATAKARKAMSVYAIGAQGPMDPAGQKAEVAL